MSGGECFPIKECDDEKTSELECVVYSAKRTIGSLLIAFRIQNLRARLFVETQL